MSQLATTEAGTKPGGISSEAVRAKTGRGWDEWIALLDAAGADRLTHAQIARYLAEQEGVGDWWCQMVTVGYEQAKGRREKHEKTDGYSAGASKTVPVPLTELYAAWEDDARRLDWLPEQPFSIRKSTPNKSMRLGWPDGSLVNVYFASKGDSRSLVSIEHGKLESRERVADLKQWWRDALDRLAAQLTN